MLGACSSIGNHVAEDEIVYSSNGRNEYPKWAYEEPRSISNNYVYVTGSVDISTEASPSRCVEATIVATSNLSVELKQRLNRQLQFASEGMNVHSQKLDNIINQETNIENLSGVSMAQSWFQK